MTYRNSKLTRLCHQRPCMLQIPGVCTGGDDSERPSVPAHSNMLKHGREPERYAAHVALGNAIRDGKVKRHPCWVCGENAEAHHAAYDLPLDVVWLCNQHHREAHAAASLYHSPPAHPAVSRTSAECIARRMSLVRE